MKFVREVEGLKVDGGSKPDQEAGIGDSGEIAVETPFAVAKEPTPEDA
jgi:hypothetical protein